jgi:hypothetical protein
MIRNVCEAFPTGGISMGGTASVPPIFFRAPANYFLYDRHLSCHDPFQAYAGFDHR